MNELFKRLTKAIVMNGERVDDGSTPTAVFVFSEMRVAFEVSPQYKKPTAIVFEALGSTYLFENDGNLLAVVEDEDTGQEEFMTIRDEGLLRSLLMFLKWRLKVAVDYKL